jgi:hypothetical protein
MRHLDEARRAAIENLGGFLRDKPAAWRVLLVEDVRAQLRALLWCPKKSWEAARDEVRARLAADAAPFWSGVVLRGAQKKGDLPDGPWQHAAWEEANLVAGQPHLRVIERHRAKTAWFNPPSDPPWRLTKGEPAIVLFYSFKGGVGRSTALAAAALRFASNGDRVVVLDADLDAPGVGYLLAGDGGLTAQWGLVDYLIERPIIDEAGEPPPDLSDYYHRCPPDLVEGLGEILVFPAGASGARYLEKLARLDYGTPPDGAPQHPLGYLLQHVRTDLAPRWILVDARAGLGDVSGFLTGGLCHLHVLLGTFSEPSWKGIELVLERLGGERLRRGESQAECLLVQAMVPQFNANLFDEAVATYKNRARDVFSDHYYADEGEDYWTLSDLESGDAPHVPVVLPYVVPLALFETFSEVAPVLREERPYSELVARLQAARKRLEESST